MQCAAAGKTNFVNARRNRRFNILAARRAGIPFPFTPGRDHDYPLAARGPQIALTKILLKQRNAYCVFRCILSALLHIAAKSRHESAYRPCADGSRGLPSFPLQIMGSVAVPSRAHRMFPYACAAITSARDAQARACGTERAGGRSPTSKAAGGAPHARQSPDRSDFASEE